MFEKFIINNTVQANLFDLLSTSTNFEDAKRINCNNRQWLPFNNSNRFREGWHYDISFLVIFYGLC